MRSARRRPGALHLPPEHADCSASLHGCHDRQLRHTQAAAPPRAPALRSTSQAERGGSQAGFPRHDPWAQGLLISAAAEGSMKSEVPETLSPLENVEINDENINGSQAFGRGGNVSSCRRLAQTSARLREPFALVVTR